MALVAEKAKADVILIDKQLQSQDNHQTNARTAI
jgi:hypothetical protein